MITTTLDDLVKWVRTAPRGSRRVLHQAPTGTGAPVKKVADAIHQLRDDGLIITNLRRSAPDSGIFNVVATRTKKPFPEDWGQ